MWHSAEWYKAWEQPVIEHGVPTKWNWVVLHPQNLKIGFGVDIGAFTLIHAGEGVHLADYVQIGGGCKIYSVDSIGERGGPIIIKEGARVGANSVILPDVVIGEHAVVGALSLVVTDVPCGATYGGVPAKPIR